MAAFARRRASATDNPQSVEAELDIVENGEPRIQGEGLEHHGDALGGAGERCPTVQHLTGTRLDEAAGDAQQGRFSGPRAAEKAQISPSADGHINVHSTGSGSPEGLVKVLQTSRRSMILGSS